MQRDALWLADLGDGRYQNPILFADYSDPDVICVEGTYYMTASSFHYVPGLPILTSTDLVNWTLRGYALVNIPQARYAVPRHAQGVWAPAIRHHGGMFYIYYGMPDEGIYAVRAADPLGQWTPPVCVLAGKGLIDPCPFWDEDGQAYVVHGYARSRIGFKSFLGIFPVSADGLRATGPDRLLYNGLATQPTIEGPKVHRRGEYIYIFAPAGGVETGWQAVLRARATHGPFEARVVMRQGDTPVNGPHQGAWVQTPEGEDWFVHFQSRGAYGRVVHLQPMRWQADGWPRIGLVAGNEAWGKPCLTHGKPRAARPTPPASLQASDDFEGDTLGLQWQFMGAWRDDFFSLAARRGALRLFAHAVPPGWAPVLWHCPQALTQKPVCPAFTAQVRMDFAGLLPGGQAGLALMGGQYAYVAVRPQGQGAHLVYVQSETAGDARREVTLARAALPVGVQALHLRMAFEAPSAGETRAAFAYSVDGEAYTPLAAPFTPSRHTWVGARPALFAMALRGEALAGSADFMAYNVVAEEV